MTALKRIGVEHPDFLIDPNESYVDNVISRQVANRSRIEDQLSRNDFAKTQSDNLIQFIEEYAIPLAVRSYRSGILRNKLGTIQWQRWGPHMRLLIYSNRERYFLKTPFSTYDLSTEIGKKVIGAFEKLPKVETKYVLQDVLTQSFLRIEIKFRV